MAASPKYKIYRGKEYVANGAEAAAQSVLDRDANPTTLTNEMVRRSDTFVLPSSDESALSSYCYVRDASSGQPYKVRKTGRLLSKPHESRRPLRVVNRFVFSGSNQLTPEAIAAELAVHGGNSREILRYDPLDAQLIDESGAYITFVGSLQAVEGVHGTLRPGETYFANWALDTKEGWTRYGQFLVTIQTERGPAWLFPDEYVVLAPDHLWYLVQDGTLRFTPNQGIGRMEFGDRVHYVRSRGIRLEDAVLMCLGDIKSDIGYFTPTSNFDEMWWKFQSAGLTPTQKEQTANSLSVLTL